MCFIVLQNSNIVVTDAHYKENAPLYIKRAIVSRARRYDYLFVHVNSSIRKDGL